MKPIPIERFNDVFTRLGWIKTEASSGKYHIWTSPNNKEVWTVVPKDINSPEYLYYQQKNIQIILYFLELEKTDMNVNDIQSQVQEYNYKLINRIVGQNSDNDSVPFEMADVLSNKNIDAFRFFYQYKNGGKAIPIESFQLHHTQKGSFIIPISISAEVGQNELFDTPSTTNTILKDYLQTLDNLFKAPTTTEKIFADRMIEDGIDSKIVKAFLGNNDSVAKTKSRYEDKIKEITISSNGSPIIDFNLRSTEKNFKKVDISKIQSLPENYLQFLEVREVEADSKSIDQTGSKIDVEVDSLDQNGTVKFSVFAIDGQNLTKPFKALSTKLTKQTLNDLTDAFKSRAMIQALGDITKPRGKMGEIVADKFTVKPKPAGLFDEDKT